MTGELSRLITRLTQTTRDAVSRIVRKRWGRRLRHERGAVSEQSAAYANVSVSVHDRDELDAGARALFATPYERLSREQREDLASLLPPAETFRESNTACIGLHEFVVDFLDKGQANPGSISGVAVGNGTAATAESDRSLTSRVETVGISRTRDDGATLFVSGFLDTTEANGYVLSELGAVAGDMLLNHSKIPTIEKTNQKTITVEITLTWSAA